MPAYLELVPRDVLQEIAFLVACTSGSVFKGPKDLLHLLLTSSTIYYSLCTTSAPSLYARLFRSTFDKHTIRRDSDGTLPTDSCLTAELVSRYRLLRRVRNLNLSASGENMHEDLYAAMRTVIESDGVNEAHLRAAGFSDFIFGYVQGRLKESFDEDPDDQTQSLALWLLVLTWSRADVDAIQEEAREQFLVLLRPFVLPGPRNASSVSQTTRRHAEDELDIRNRHSDGGHASETDGIVSQRQLTVCPDVASAAIVLTFILKEANATPTPPPLPAERVTDSTNGRSGPTIHDYYVMAKYQTALFGDDSRDTGSACQELPRSIRHDPQFFPALRSKVPGSDAYSRLADLLTGVWEGVYMVSSSQSKILPDLPDFICKKPLQCSLALYFCINADSASSHYLGDDISKWTVSPNDFSSDCLAVSGRRIPYEKLVSQPRRKCQVSEICSQAAECLVIGQTSEEHDEAWGGFNFAGKMKRDGSIVMKREPKNSSDASLGTWTFEGNLRYGTALVGTWRSSVLPAQDGVHGIFSMAKKAAADR